MPSVVTAKSRATLERPLKNPCRLFLDFSDHRHPYSTSDRSQPTICRNPEFQNQPQVRNTRSPADQRATLAPEDKRCRSLLFLLYFSEQHRRILVGRAGVEPAKPHTRPRLYRPLGSPVPAFPTTTPGVNRAATFPPGGRCSSAPAYRQTAKPLGRQYPSPSHIPLPGKL